MPKTQLGSTEDLKASRCNIHRTMQKGFVLLNCDIGAEEFIVSRLQQIKDITNAYLTLGAYDVIAEVSAPTQESFEDTVASIRSLSRVVSTMTLNVVDS